MSKQGKLRANKDRVGIYVMPFFKVGNKVLYQREAIMKWFSKLQEKEVNATE